MKKQILFLALTIFLGTSMIFAEQLKQSNLCDMVSVSVLDKLYPNVSVKKSGNKSRCTLNLSHPDAISWQVMIQKDNWDGNYEYRKQHFSKNKSFKMLEGLGEEALEVGTELWVKVDSTNIFSIKTQILIGTKEPAPIVTVEAQKKAMLEMARLLVNP